MQTQRVFVGRFVLVVTTWPSGGRECSWWYRGRCLGEWYPADDG